MSINSIKRNIRADITTIDETLKQQNYTEIKRVHMMIDAKYQNRIDQWGKSQYGWSGTHGFIYNSLDCNSLMHNLQNMKNKLEGYLQELDLKQLTNNQEPSKSINFYNSNENTINNNLTNINFNSVEQKIKECEALTDEETKEALTKLKELQKICESNDNRKNKWEKSKKILIWLADKSIDIAIAYFPIIMSIFK